jgi:isocitrate/isopropylmalate dehydrogenase
VNSIAMIQSVKLMIDLLGEKNKTKKLELTIADVIMERIIKTYDIVGSNTSSEIAEEIAKKFD